MDNPRDDSPRHHDVRNSYEEQEADRLIAKLGGPRLARDPHGNVVRLNPLQPTKAGWTPLGPAPAACSHELWEIPGRQSPSGITTPAKVVRHHRGLHKTLAAKGWRCLGPAVADEPLPLSPDEHEGLLARLDVRARDVNRSPDRTGASMFDGGEYLPLYATESEAPIATKHADRIGEKATKPHGDE
jgi:hypothetical protein